MALVPINMAEAIIHPFWDPECSDIDTFTISDGKAHGLSVKQGWAQIAYEWSGKPEGPALELYREENLDISGYDQLMVSIVMPKGVALELLAKTDAGMRTIRLAAQRELQKEYFLPLEGARMLENLTLRLHCESAGVAVGWINWIGLQNTAFLDRFMAQYRRFDENWGGYLTDNEVRFAPTYGLYADEKTLTRLAQKHETFLKVNGHSPFVANAELSRAMTPEHMVNDYVNFWGDTRFCRDRDAANWLVRHGVYAAVAAMLTRDAALMRLAARYALAISFCDNWDDGFICRFPGSSFDHRCFVQTLCMSEIALIMDFAGELFTPLAVNHFLRRFVDEGEAAVQFSVFRHEYIFSCNQMVWFSAGRMAGYAVLEKHYPRAKAYADLAFEDLKENFERTILSDGSYEEGPVYFGCVGNFGGEAMHLYARMRGKALRDIVPPVVLRTAMQAQVLYSTDDEYDMIPICDATNQVPVRHLAVMASFIPDSVWTTLYRRAIKRTGDMPDTLLALILDETIPESGPLPDALVTLDEVGCAASHRMLDGQLTKVFVMGNRHDAGHNHEDKGSFVWEAYGEVIAFDPGVCDYSNPLAIESKHASRHNMLLPFGLGYEPHAHNPLKWDIRPSVKGDETFFQADFMLDGVFPQMPLWRRTIKSDSPEKLSVTDRYELEQGEGVVFCWSTPHPAHVEGSVAIIEGACTRTEVCAPEGMEMTVEKLPYWGGKDQYRIAIRLAGRAGEFTVHARTAPRG